jgi:hypothetical protein
MKITRDTEFEDALVKRMYEKEFSIREGCHISDLIYCLTPETKILTSQLTWIPIKEVHSGDKLVGLDENNTGLTRRRMRETVVTNRSSHIEQVYLVRFSNGQSLKATALHKWLVRPIYGGSWSWRETKNLVKGWKIAWLQEPWEVDNSKDAGYLSGIYDGEGCVYRGTVSVAQKEGLVLNKIQEILTKKGFTYYINNQHDAKYSVKTLNLNSVGKALKFLGSIRPIRLLSKKSWVGVFPAGRVDSIVTIKDVIPSETTEVIGITTDAHTFNAEGFWTHNCLNKQVLRRKFPLPPNKHDILLFSLGWSTQRWLTGASKDEDSVEIDGIKVTLDAIAQYPWELKCSFQSSAKPVEENLAWVRQVMAQCYVKKSLSARITRFELMGNWKSIFGKKEEKGLPENQKPDLHAFRFDFDQSELDDNWIWAKVRRDEFNKMLAGGLLLPRALSLPGKETWECDYCPPEYKGIKCLGG